MRTLTFKGSATLLLSTALALALAGCDKPKETNKPEQNSGTDYPAISIVHQLGTTTITKQPQRVVAFDMGELDSLDQLGAPVVGVAKDYVVGFLSKYKDDPKVTDVGATVQPNLESLHKLKPDLILISPLQAQSYAELSEIAPTLHFDIDMTNKQGDVIAVAQEHLLTLGRIFGKEQLAQQINADISDEIAQARKVIDGRPEKALLVLHNNGAFASYGVKSRYGFVFDTLGVKSASADIETGVHGQPISNEFIQQADPDIIYVIDRTAVMERRAALNRDSLDNPLLRQTKAWANNKVIFVDSDTWYLCTASPTCIKRITAEVLQGYAQ